MADDINIDAIEKDQEQAAEIVKPPRPRRYNRRASDRQTVKSSAWLISFTDVMALMLTFFVLLFSMSNPDPAKWELMKGDLKDTLQQNKQASDKTTQGKALNRGAQDTININKVDFEKALSLSYLEKLFQKQIDQDPLLKQIIMMKTNNGLIISLPQQLLFSAGQAAVGKEGEKALFNLAGILSRVKNRVEIVGHTDPRNISGDQFRSNWELSLARATNVAGILEKVGYTNNVTVRGHGSARYSDLSVEIPLLTRRDLSRRVDIVIMEDDGRSF